MSQKSKGIIIFVVLIIVGIGASFLLRGKEGTGKSGRIVKGAIGGGKENFLKDEDVTRILLEKYNITLEYDDWSNNKLIKDDLVNTQGEVYDIAFFSDERFYEYYKTPASGEEVSRLPVLKGEIQLNTPIVIYSWNEVVEKLTNENIVTKRNGINYISDMNKLLTYIVEDKKWNEIGLNDMYGRVNIISTDPVTSSPGATYYGLLASIMNEGYVDKDNVNDVLPNLTDFYKKSGFMNNTPADLFDLYLRTGRGTYPLIVDYEKSIIDFAYRNPSGFDQVKNKIKILYPEPTTWNSHCIVSFSDIGTEFIDALNDEEIARIGWEKYGFRTGLNSTQNLSTDIIKIGISEEVMSVTPGLKKNIYDIIVEELKSSITK